MSRWSLRRILRAGRKKGQTADLHTCPYCGSTKIQPGDIDEWICGNCWQVHPTTAYKCKHEGCWNFAFSGDYCEEHTPSAHD
jgi:ribosomal protein L37AE/L43A